MLSSKVTTAFLALAGAVAAVCPAATRQASAELVINSYNQNSDAAAAAGFAKVPWGDPNTAGGCYTVIIADGACAIPAATTGTGTYEFAVESRQVFSHLTGQYTNFDNGTTVINTVVTLGHQTTIGTVPIPVSFIGHVYMDYDDNCRIYQARAYARVPYQVLNETFAAVNLNLPAPLCGAEP